MKQSILVRPVTAGFLVATVTAALALAGAVPGVAGSAAPTPADVLDTRDAQLLEAARSAGKSTVTVIMATDKGGAGAVASAVERLGGTVARQFDRTGYVLAAVPTGGVVSAATLPGVAAVDLDETLRTPDPRPEASRGEKALQAIPVGPGAGTGASNPFLPTHETGAVAFKQANPTFDGRGVTIGIMDSGVDVDHPALRTTSTGERKIADWVTATDPVLDGDGSWRPMITPVTGPTFSYASTSWTAPAGAYRIGQFAERTAVGDAYAGDVNRDGDNTDSFGILYDPVSRDIRVDSDQDRNFVNNPVMRPYRERYDIGHFGVDKPNTAVRERVAFVVQVKANVSTVAIPGVPPRTYDYVNIGIPSSDHGSHVAGIAAGESMFGNNNLDGVAPGAKIVSMRACLWAGGCSSSALMTGMTDLVENYGVDVINMSIGGVIAVNDGNSARGILYNRLITERGVQIFVSAGNSGPGVNTVGDPSVATNAVAVGSSVSKATALANYGSPVDRANFLHAFSSRGPAENGGFKPNIVAPGSAISAIPTWLPGVPTPGVGYVLPPGYAMMQGTSMAAPQSTGAAALLLSAAKARKVAVSPAVLRRAIYSSATWVPDVPAHGQGNGQFNVPAAWALLEKAQPVRSYLVDAPVCTALASQLAEPRRGTGIYNRCPATAGGQKPEVAKSYQVTLTRTDGPVGAITHQLRWVGNDGVFRSPGEVDLPLGTPVAVTVTATPPAGVHSGILRVDDPATAVVDFEFLNTVVAAGEVKGPYLDIWRSGSVERNAATSVFLNVPLGTAKLKLSVGGLSAGSQVRLLATDPMGVPTHGNGSASCYTNLSDPAECDPQHREYELPQAGVWELQIESRRTSPIIDNAFQLTAATEGLSLDLQDRCNWYLLDGHGAHASVSYLDAQPVWAPDPVTRVVSVPGRNPNGRGALTFDGTRDQGMFTKGIAGHEGSFTVAAWVRLTETTKWHTAVSEHGQVGPVFQLAYNNAARSWEFTVTEGMPEGPDRRVSARSTAVTPNVWTHLAGTYSSEEHSVTLYVNGVMAETLPIYRRTDRAGYYFSIGRDHIIDLDHQFVPGPGTWSGDLADVGFCSPLEVSELRKLSSTDTEYPGFVPHA